MNDETLLKEETQFFKERINFLAEQMDKLNKKLDASRTTSVRLIDEAQRLNDRSLVTLIRHNTIAALLPQEKDKVLDCLRKIFY